MIALRSNCRCTWRLSSYHSPVQNNRIDGANQSNSLFSLLDDFSFNPSLVSARIHIATFHRTNRAEFMLRQPETRSDGLAPNLKFPQRSTCLMSSCELLAGICQTWAHNPRIWLSAVSHKKRENVRNSIDRRSLFANFRDLTRIKGNVIPEYPRTEHSQSCSNSPVLEATSLRDWCNCFSIGCISLRENAALSNVAVQRKLFLVMYYSESSVICTNND